jgi:hypothetical protein
MKTGSPVSIFRNGRYTHHMSHTCWYSSGVVVVSLYKPSMQKLCNLAHDHSRKWGTIATQEYPHCYPLWLVSIYWSKPRWPLTFCSQNGEASWSNTRSRQKDIGGHMLENLINCVRGTFHASMGIGSYILPISTSVTAKNWQTNGLELIYIPAKCMERLECTKRIQGLPEQAANLTALPALGVLVHQGCAHNEEICTTKGL